MENGAVKQAQVVYENICQTLKSMNWKFDRQDDDLMIHCGIQGDDLPMDFYIFVNSEAQVVSLISPMPFKISEDKRIDAAVAVCLANYKLVNGCFDYDIGDGEIRFRIVSSFRDSVLGEELYKYMLLVSASTIDDYNEKFFMLSKGMITIQQFIELENGGKND